MRRRSLGIVSVFFLAVIGFSFLFAFWQGGFSAPWRGQGLKYARQSMDGQAMLGHVERLASPAMAGRRTGTDGEAKAGEYIAAEFRRLGLQGAGEAGTFFQTFPLVQRGLAWNGPRLHFTAQEGGGSQGDNVLALLPGKNREKTLILSAHYDHLGVFEGQLFPGANDNASGVAVLLEAARLAKAKDEPPKVNLLFAAWSGEEMGYVGANYFVRRPSLALGQVIGILNVDSVASGPSGQFIAWSPSPEDEIYQALEEAASQGGWNLQLADRGQHGSDHLPFTNQGMAGATLLAANWLDDNHTPKDTPALVNPAKLLEGGQLVWAAVEELAY